MFIKLRQKRLERYVRKYFKKYPVIKLVVVTGSIGKTQAKTAIATILSQRYRVRMFHGNRGTNFTTPLAILGIDYPEDIRGPRAWHKVFKAVRQRIRQPQDTDVIVLELNATGPGSLMRYAEYITPDISVVTAISESNIEAFQSLDFVAQEQLSIGTISRHLFINRDDIDSRYAAYLTNPNMNTYGLDGAAEYHFEEVDFSLEKGYEGSIILPGWESSVSVASPVYDSFTLKQLVGACAVGAKLGLQAHELSEGIASFHSLTGHMTALEGSEGSVILDDTANTSPLGARTAMQTLYRVQSPQRIAVLGSMRRLGSFSQTAHQEIGMLCDSTQLSWVVTVGDEANRWIAPAARGRGCQVKECSNAVEAGAFVHGVLEEGGVVLFSGHEQDYLEEGVKVVLRTARDGDKLVRQSGEWLEKKAEALSHFKG